MDIWNTLEDTLGEIIWFILKIIGYALLLLPLIMVSPLLAYYKLDPKIGSKYFNLVWFIEFIILILISCGIWYFLNHVSNNQINLPPFIKQYVLYLHYDGLYICYMISMVAWVFLSLYRHLINLSNDHTKSKVVIK